MLDDTTLAEIQAAYGASCAKYEQLVDKQLQKSDTIIISDYGCALRVKNDALVILPGKSHKDQQQENVTLYRGVHNIKQIILLGDKGLVTLDAIRWATEQNITVMMIDGRGNLMQVLTPEHESYASLRRLQYHAADNGLDIFIARELIHRKTLAQIEVLKAISEYKYKRVFKKYRANRNWEKPVWELLESEMVELPYMEELRSILILEARLAAIYWDTFIGIPIHWKPSDKKKVPPHWHCCMERVSSLSGRQTAQHANNPYQAVTNYAYALLQGQCKQSLISQGFDTACGFLHVDQLHRDSLVFDIMECHRAQVDRVVLHMFASHTLSKGEFMSTKDGSVQFNPQFTRFIAASCRIPQADIDDSVSWLKYLLVGS